MSKKQRKDDSFIKKPIYPGGQKAINALISSNIKYPPRALENKIEGTVQLRYDIDHKGNVVGSKVISSLGHGCDEEAQRLVKLLKFKIPKNPRKLKIIFHKTIRIHFKLPNAQLALQYKTQESKLPPSQKVKQKSYTYTISW